VTLNGINQPSTTNSIIFSQANGKYTYSVGAVQGYTCSSSQGSVTVSGSNVVQRLTFTKIPIYAITFAETGLAGQTTWSVTLTGVGTQTATAPNTIVFTVPNGAYSYTVAPIGGYTASPPPSTITVNGMNISQTITYTITATLQVESQFSGYFLEYVPFTNEFGVYAGLVGGNAPVEVYGILDGVNYTFSNSGSSGYYGLSVNMGLITPGSSLNVTAVYSGGKVSTSYPIQIIQTPSWLSSIETYEFYQHVQPVISGQWNNGYVLSFEDHFDLTDDFSINIPLPNYAGGGTYSLLPSADLQFSFSSSGALSMSGQFTLESPELDFGPVAVTPHLTISASGQFELQSNSITWTSATLSLDIGADVEASPPSPIGISFYVDGYGWVTLGLTLTATISANIAVNMILAPTQNTAQELIQPLEIMLQKINGQISLDVGVAVNAGIAIGSVTGGGELDFSVNLQAASPCISGGEVTGTIYVDYKILCWSGTIWSDTKNPLYQWGSDPQMSSDPASNFTFIPRYYNTSNYERLVWTSGCWNGTAVQDIYPFTRISVSSCGNNAYVIYTTDNTSAAEQYGLRLTGLEFNSSGRTTTRLVMPTVSNEIFFNPTLFSLSNGTFLAMWDSIPFAEIGNDTNPLGISEIIPQYSCYNAGTWSPVRNLTANGVATSYLLSSNSAGCYALVLEGNGIFSSNQYVAEYDLNSNSELMEAGVANVSSIVSFNAFSQLAVLQLFDGSYEILNLTSHELIAIPSMNGYGIMSVQLATNSTGSVGILYTNATSNVFCVYNASSNAVSFSMNIPQTPKYLTFAQQGSEYRLVTADNSGITSYFIAAQNATHLFYPLQNITSMGSTITNNGILVYTTENYGNSTNPLLNLTLTFIPNVNITVLNVTSSKTVVGQGFSDSINVTVTNQGSYTETFKATVFANATSIASQNLTLSIGNSATTTFVWNTTGVPYGSYTIKVQVALAPSETNTANNTFVYGIIKVTIPGDIDGEGYVGPRSLGLLLAAYNTYAGYPEYNPNADIDSEGYVGARALGILLANYNKYS
jgi:hypothetical protein